MQGTWAKIRIVFLSCCLYQTRTGQHTSLKVSAARLLFKQEGMLKGGKHGPVPTYLRGVVLWIAVLFFCYYNRVGHECTTFLGFDCYLRAQTQSPSYDALKEEKKSLWSTRKGKANSSAWKYFLFKGTNEEQQMSKKFKQMHNVSEATKSP